MTLIDIMTNMEDKEFIDEAQNYWEDGFDDVVDEVKEYYMNCDFKKDRRGH